MTITELVLKNFKSFGPGPTTILLNDLIAPVGTNAG